MLTAAHDLPTHLATRLLMGLSQGAALPATVLLLTRWVPERRRGLANAVVAFGGRFAQAAATVVTPLVIVSFVPLCGLLGVIVAAVAVAVWLAVRGRQAPHAAQETSGAFPWRALFASGNQWLSCGLSFFSNYGWVLFMRVTPMLLEGRFRMWPGDRNSVMTVPLFAMLAGGVTTDWLTRRSGKR